MPNLIFNGKQYTITIPKEVIEATRWKKGQNLYVGKEKDSNIVFIEIIKEVKKK